MEWNRLDDLIDDIHKEERSICEFCKMRDECEDLARCTKPPMPLCSHCRVFYMASLKEAAKDACSMGNR